MQLDELDDSRRRVTHDGRRLVLVVLLIAEITVDLLHAQARERGQRPLDRGVQHRLGSRESNLGGGDVRYERLSGAVENHTARRGYCREAQRVVLDRRERGLVVDHLQEKETNDQRDQKNEEKAADDDPAPRGTRAHLVGRRHKVADTHGLWFVDGSSPAAKGVQDRKSTRLNSS